MPSVLHSRHAQPHLTASTKASLDALSDARFLHAFGCYRDAFDKLAPWKQRQLLRAAGFDVGETKILATAKPTTSSSAQEAAAATKVQSLMRGKAARLEAEAEAEAQAVALAAELAALQAVAGDYDAQMAGIRTQVNERHDAAAKVQKVFMRKKAEEVDDDEMAALAAEIAALQAVAGDYDAQVGGIRAEVDQRHDAAAKVQKVFMRKKAEEVDDDEMAALAAEIAALQAVAGDYDAQVGGIRAEVDQRHDAAAKVQSLMRGKSARVEATAEAEAQEALLAAELAVLQAEAGDYDAQMASIRAEVDQRHDAASKVQKLVRKAGGGKGGAAPPEDEEADEEPPRRQSVIEQLGSWWQDVTGGGDEAKAAEEASKK